MIAVELGGITFYGSTSDGDWTLRQDGLTGWFDGPPVRSSVIDRPGEHGQISPRAFRNGRTIGLEVQCETRSDAAIGAAVDAITALLADGEYGTMTVTRPDGLATSASVRLNGAPLVQTDGWRSASAQIELFAPDPRRFGAPRVDTTALPSTTGGLTVGTAEELGTIPFAIDAVTVTGQVSLHNPGTTAGPVVLRIDGPVTGPIVTHVSSGKALVFSSSLTLGAGEFVTVDMERREVLAQGTTSRNGWVTGRGWSAFQPGDNTWSFTAVEYDPGALLTVTATPAWL